MNLKDLNNLQRIEDNLIKIKAILNPEDSPYLCDAIVTNIADPDLRLLTEAMLKRMGYQQKIIVRIKKLIKEIQK